MKEKRRKSYITIILVVIFIIILACICIVYDLKHERIVQKVISKDYASIFKEEDEMQYEYDKINSELKNLRAFAISDNFVVGVKDTGITTNIVQIDTNYTYDYVYSDTKLYLLEKETGKISIIPLKTDSGSDYVAEQTIEIGKKVDSIQVYNEQIYYLSEGTLYKRGEDSNPVFENISSDKFIIKLDYLYIIKDNNLLKVDINTKEEKILANNVIAFDYFNYYEKNKIIFETSIDGQNCFKNILNVYSDEINNSINNNEYFAVYGANEYIYLTNDKKAVYLIEKNGNNKMLYNSNSPINEVIFIKEGFIIVENEDSKVIVNLETKKVDGNFDTNIDNIKYIK